MGYSGIDPDGVLAMSAGTLAAATSVGQIGREISQQTDKVSHLVPGAPASSRRADTEAGTLATIAGFAKQHALTYVDDVEPLRELASMGYWLPDLSKLGWDSEKTVSQNVETTARSDEFGAFVLGTAGALMDRYRNWSVYVPKTDTPGGRAALARFENLIAMAPDETLNGAPFVRRASGLLVPQGSSLDPRMPEIMRAADEGTYRPGPSLTVDPELGRPPSWARYGSRGLFVAGAVLTAWDAGASQWEHDQQYHPEWSTGQRVASAGYNVVTEGGGAIAGGYVGAEIGAAVGSFVPIPVVGTLGGALIGGAIGAFVGSKAGKAVGTALKEGGEALADGAKKVWNSVFG